MLDHVFTDAISALRDAFESAYLERQPFEEHFQSDVLVGDLTWETSYGLPGEGEPPRIVAHITMNWPAWSQAAYRQWYVEEELEKRPAIEMEIVLRIQRLSDPADPAVLYATVPEQSPLVGDDRLVIRSLDNCSITLLERDADGNLSIAQTGHEADTLIR